MGWRLEAVAIRLEAGGHRYQVGGLSISLEAIAIRSESESLAIGLEAIASRLEAKCYNNNRTKQQNQSVSEFLILSLSNINSNVRAKQSDKQERHK